MTQTLLQGWHTLATELLMNCPSGQEGPQTVAPMCLYRAVLEASLPHSVQAERPVPKQAVHPAVQASHRKVEGFPQKPFGQFIRHLLLYRNRL